MHPRWAQAVFGQSESMNIKDIKQKTFKSGPLAMTDIHNAGTIFGVIYYEMLSFGDNNVVEIKNEIILNRGVKDYENMLREDKWTGTYRFDIDGKHAECVLHNSRNKKIKKMYVDFATNELLICEVYEGTSQIGQGQVFQFVQ